MTTSDVLKRQNDRLISLSEKSRYLRDYLDPVRGEPKLYDLVEVVEAEVSKARQQYKNSTIHVEAPPEANIRAHHNIDMAIGELIENAIEHNSISSPTVWLTVEGGPQWVTLTVEDNGPGIPESERAVLHQIYETSLEHSQGLGLWLVQLTIDVFDGELIIEDRDDEGSKVTVNLPSPK